MSCGNRSFRLFGKLKFSDLVRFGLGGFESLRFWLWRIFRNVDGDVWTWTGKAYPYQAPATRTTWLAHIRPAVGSRLWVRESHYVWSAGYKDGSGRRIDYRATEPDAPCTWTPSIHMPRWASRATLLVTSIKLERLQSITPADAIAEGISPAANSQTIDCDTPNPVHAFRDLWNSLHGSCAWDENPVVAAISFSINQTNIDKMEAA